jgi:DNA-binding NtrC family response regulator
MQTTNVSTALKVQEQSEPTMQILVIDDSEIDRQRLIRLCRSAGLRFDATEVTTLAEMREALADTNFDIVFIDYLLAGEDGLQAVELLSGFPGQTGSSIMIAGEGRLDVAVEAMRRGCADYITKSGLTVEAIQKSIATSMERRMLSLSLHEER